MKNDPNIYADFKNAGPSTRVRFCEECDEEMYANDDPDGREFCLNCGTYTDAIIAEQKAKPEQIIITIVGGVAYLKKKPAGIEVLIVDWDNAEDDRDIPASVSLYGAPDIIDQVDEELLEALTDSNYQ